MRSLENYSRVVGLFLVTMPLVAFPHHSLIGYDENKLVEVEGEVTAVFWRNPHIRLTVRSMTITGQEESWQVEGGPVNSMERRGIRPDTVIVGDTVKVLGIPSIREANTMRPIYITLASAQELVLDQERASAFGLLNKNESPTGPILDDEDVASAIRQASGIFRVWSNQGWYADSKEWGVEIHPLRDAGKVAQEQWDQSTDDLASRCIQAGMPEAMMNPFPIEFMEQDGDIIIHIEEWDNVRTVHLGGVGDVENLPATSLGYSVGHWEGDTLIVRTNNINYLFLDDRGTPQSAAVEIVERFTLSKDETRLDWAATVVDPETFTEPVIMPELHWEWVPGETLKTYNCTLADD